MLIQEVEIQQIDFRGFFIFSEVDPSTSRWNAIPPLNILSDRYTGVFVELIKELLSSRSVGFERQRISRE